MYNIPNDMHIAPGPCEPRPPRRSHGNLIRPRPRPRDASRARLSPCRKSKRISKRQDARASSSPVFSAEWSPEEQRRLEDALARFPTDSYSSLERYVRAAAELKEKSVRDASLTPQ